MVVGVMALSGGGGGCDGVEWGWWWVEGRLN